MQHDLFTLDFRPIESSPYRARKFEQVRKKDHRALRFIKYLLATAVVAACLLFLCGFVTAVAG